MKRSKLSFRILSSFVTFIFLGSTIVPPGNAQVISYSVLNLPAPGSMILPSHGYTPLIVRGLTIDPENPLRFSFIMDSGDTEPSWDELSKESLKIIKYFLASLTIPENKMWVNLSPYEQNRAIDQAFGDTEMGRDLLAQDYLLKQLTASLMYPEQELGKDFWQRVYKRAQEEFGTTEIPINTFNKVWIVPDKAVVYEYGNSIYVAENTLNIMLEQDYLALQKNLHNEALGMNRLVQGDAKTISSVSSQIVREIIIPEIKKEINEGSTFANLRQMYNAMILAAWYKINLKASLLGQVYVDQAKTMGVENLDKQINEKIYHQYVEAFKKGVFNYIKEDLDPATQKTIPRKYFSGGAKMEVKEILVSEQVDGQTLSSHLKDQMNKGAGEDHAMLSEVVVDLYDVGSQAAASSEAISDMTNSTADKAAQGVQNASPKTLGIKNKLLALATGIMPTFLWATSGNALTFIEKGENVQFVLNTKGDTIWEAARLIAKAGGQTDVAAIKNAILAHNNLTESAARQLGEKTILNLPEQFHSQGIMDALKEGFRVVSLPTQAADAVTTTSAGISEAVQASATLAEEFEAGGDDITS